ncbi:MAG: bifunctional 5,10-methylenetetrahydrofolate dehydrogenase/5,10-methenyltetrahydrofolate cyclohydrolase [Gaiellaceae bacterium]
MPATIMDGKALAAKVQAEVAAAVSELGEIGLATVLVGDDPASHVYIRRKHAAAREVGIRSDDRRLPADTSQEELLEVIAELNADDSIQGVLVQSPLPPGLDEARTMEALDPAKDVDGFHPANAGQLYLGRPRLVPATPLGVMRLLDEHGVQIAGARAVVIGRSNIVGKPMAHLLLQANATVSICHSRTADIPGLTRMADILVAAVGVPHLVTPDAIKEGAAVVDVGMNRTDGGLVGDVDPAAAGRAAFITPVPGGVGPMTIAMLLANTVKAAQAQRETLANHAR